MSCTPFVMLGRCHYSLLIPRKCDNVFNIDQTVTKHLISESDRSNLFNSNKFQREKASCVLKHLLSVNFIKNCNSRNISWLTVDLQFFSQFLHNMLTLSYSFHFRQLTCSRFLDPVSHLWVLATFWTTQVLEKLLASICLLFFLAFSGRNSDNFFYKTDVAL